LGRFSVGLAAKNQLMQLASPAGWDRFLVHGSVFTEMQAQITLPEIRRQQSRKRSSSKTVASRGM
jgi:hypothetical protein